VCNRKGIQGRTCGVARRMEERCFLGSIGRSLIATLSSSSCSKESERCQRPCVHLHRIPRCTKGHLATLQSAVGVCRHASMRRCALASSTGSCLSVVISAMSVRSLGPLEMSTPFVAGGAAHDTFGASGQMLCRIRNDVLDGSAYQDTS
jgi:hypothetical protein